MDSLGPRIMVNVGTQAVSNTGINPRDLAPLTNNAFLATFMGKPMLPSTNGTSRQSSNYRPSFTTQIDRETLRTKLRPSTTNGESIEPDSAILSVIRSNGSEQTTQRQLQENNHHGNNRRSFHQQRFFSGWNNIPCSPNYRPTNDFNRQRRTRSGGAQKQITVVDQMAAQPHIPYAILPKRFEPKQVANNGSQQQLRSSNSNTNNKNSNRHYRPNVPPRRPQRQQQYYDDQWEDVEDNIWSQSNIHRQFNRPLTRGFRPPTTGFLGLRSRTNNYYNSYSYDPVRRQGQGQVLRRRTTYQNDGYIPFNIVPSYDLNEWQGPYARSKNSQKRGTSRNGHKNNNFIRDDHRVANALKQSRSSSKSLTASRSRKQTKPNKIKPQQKRRNSRQRKARNQNSKNENQDKSLTVTNEVKSSCETETTNEEKSKEESISITTSEVTIKTETVIEENPLPPRESENKENEGEKQIEQNS